MKRRKTIPSLHPRTQEQAKSNAAFYWIAAGSALLCSLRQPQYQMGIMNDDAVYVLGARALVHHLKFTSLMLKGDYPMPGVSLLLAPFVRMIEPNWVTLEWFSVLATLLSIFIFYRWTSRCLSAGETITATALLAFNPVIVRLSGILMPAPYYTAAILGSFWLLSEWLEKPTRLKALALGAVVGWGALMRPEGVILLVSIMGTMLWVQHGRKLLGTMMIPLTAWAIFFIFWWHMHPNSHSEYGSDLDALRTYWSQHFVAGLHFSEQLMRVFFFRAITLITPAEDPLWIAFTWLGVGLVLASVGAGLRNLWTRWPEQRPVWSGVAIFCILHLVVHLFWHVPARRYAIPVLPFVILFMVRGMPELLSRVRLRKIWIGLMLSIILASYSYRHVLALQESIPEINPMKSPPRQSLVWLQDHIAPGSKIMSNIAANIELYVNHPALSGIQTKNIDLLEYELLRQGFSYIVYRDLTYLTPGVEGTEDPNDAWRQLLSMIGRYPKRFSPVFENALERTKIYRVLPDADYCPAYETLNLASRRYQAGLFAEAFQLVNQSVTLCPRIGNAQNLLGALYLRRADFSHANDAFQKAADLLPDSSKSLLNLATLNSQMGNNELAQQYLRRALEAGTAGGESEQTRLNVDALSRMWAQKRAVIFLDFSS